MNYDETLEYLEQKVNILGSVLGLDSIREVLNRIGNPQEKLRFIHIAGTNGKGSVSTFLAQAFMENGFRVGRFLSPTILDYREQIQVNGKMITKAAVVKGFGELFAAANQMKEEGFLHPTAFELETALAFWYFVEKKCDIVILETGMGGTMDATNIISENEIAVITSVSMDHMQYLGNTLYEIAQKKAGIIKQGSPVITISQNEEIMKAVEETAKERHSSCIVADASLAAKVKYGLTKQSFVYKEFGKVEISLSGSYQIENAVLALEALKACKKLGWKLNDEKILYAFACVRWPARFEVLWKKPYLIADGAHNIDAVKKLMETVRFYFTNRKIVYIMGILKDKEFDEMIRESFEEAAYIITVTPPNPQRAMPALELAKTIKQYHSNVTAADSVPEALEMAALLAGEDGVIIAFGSLSYMGELRNAASLKRGR